MNIRSFFLGFGLLIGVAFANAAPVEAAKLCYYSSCTWTETTGPTSGTVHTYTPNSKYSGTTCEATSECTRDMCTAFCSAHPPSPAPSMGYAIACATSGGIDCRARPTSGSTSTPAPTPTATPGTGGTGTTAGTSSGGSTSGSASTGADTTRVLAPLAPGVIGPGRCAYQCRSGTAPTRDIGVVVGCASDADCTADCAGRCEQASAPGSVSGNGLGSFSGHCVGTLPGPHCILPTAPSAADPTAAAAPHIASGASETGPSEELPNALGNVTSLTEIFGRIVKAVLGLVGALALFWFVWGGILWMTARGQDSQVKEGKEVIQNAAIGLLIIFFAYTLTSAFLGVFEAARTSTTTTTSSSASH